VHNNTPDEKLGVVVAVRYDKLFIHEVAPNGLFPGTAQEIDKWCPLWNKPSGNEVLRIAKEAQDCITIVVKKRIVAPIEL
jgi:hypothetical protein